MSAIRLPERGRRCFDQLPATIERLLTGTHVRLGARRSRCSLERFAQSRARLPRRLRLVVPRAAARPRPPLLDRVRLRRRRRAVDQPVSVHHDRSRDDHPQRATGRRARPLRMAPARTEPEPPDHTAAVLLLGRRSNASRSPECSIPRTSTRASRSTLGSPSTASGAASPSRLAFAPRLSEQRPPARSGRAPVLDGRRQGLAAAAAALAATDARLRAVYLERGRQSDAPQSARRPGCRRSIRRRR